jgi:hypothetical protein
LITAKHLQHQSAQIAQALLADAEQGPAFLAQLPRVGQRPTRGACPMRARDCALVLTAKTCEQRWARHASQCNSEV